MRGRRRLSIRRGNEKECEDKMHRKCEMRERERCGKERVRVVMRWFGGWWRNQRKYVRYLQPAVVAQEEGSDVKCVRCPEIAVRCVRCPLQSARYLSVKWDMIPHI